MYFRLRSDRRVLMTDIKRSPERQVYTHQQCTSLSSPKRVAIPPRLAAHMPRVAVTPLIALPEGPVPSTLARAWVSPAGPFLDQVQSPLEARSALPPASMWRLPRPPLHH